MAAPNANENEPPSYVALPNNLDISPINSLIEDCLRQVGNGFISPQPSNTLIFSKKRGTIEGNGFYRKGKLARRLNGKRRWLGFKSCQFTSSTLNGYHHPCKLSTSLGSNLESHFSGSFEQRDRTFNRKTASSALQAQSILGFFHGRTVGMHLLTITKSIIPDPNPRIDPTKGHLVYSWLMGASEGLFGLNHFRDETKLDALTGDLLANLLSTPSSPTNSTKTPSIESPPCFSFKKGLGIDSIIGKIWSSKRLNQQSCLPAPLKSSPNVVTTHNGRYRKTFLPKRHYKGKPPPKASGKGWVRVVVPVNSQLLSLDENSTYCPTSKGTPPQYETRAFKRLKDMQNNKGAAPNFALEPVELSNSLDTLSTAPSPVNASSASRGSNYDAAIESVILKLCHNDMKASLVTKKKNDSAGGFELNAGLGSASIKTEPNDTSNSDICQSTPTPQVNEVGTPLPSPSSIIPSRRTAKEEIPHFEHIDENIYAYDEEKSTDKNARKQAKRMICNCEAPVDPLSRDKADDNDVAIATTTTTKDPALTAKVASLVSAIFTPKSGGCGPDCLNRLLMIECSNRCPCGDLCTNKQFQKRIYAQLEPFMTFTKGWGLRTLQDIETGKFVIEYVGEVIDSKEFNKRQKLYHKDKRIHYYFMSLKQGQIIDATNKGSYSRFINHSCDPNCETQKWTVNGKLRIGIFARRRISKYSELTFDYQSQRYGREPQKCYCGSFNCRGYIDKNYLPTAAILPTQLPSDERVDCQANGSSAGSPEIGSTPQNDPWLAEEMGEMLAQLNVQAVQSTVPDVNGSSNNTLVVGGMTDSKQIIRFCRLMVRTEKLELQRKLLQVLKLTRKDLLNIFINLQGLNLLWTWMTTLTNAPLDLDFKLELLDALDILPIQNRDTLERSKLPRIVEKWAVKPEYSREIEANHDLGTHREIAAKSQNLLEKWKDIKDVYKIPKKRDSNGYESQSSSHQINGMPTGNFDTRSHLGLGDYRIGREEFDRGSLEKCAKLNGINGDPYPPPYPYEANRNTPTFSQNHHPEDLRRTSVEDSKYCPSPSQTNLPYQRTTTPQREIRGEKVDDDLKHYHHSNDRASTSSNQCFHVNHLTPSPAPMPKNTDSPLEGDGRHGSHKLDQARHRSSRDYRRESSHSSRHGSSYREGRDEKSHHHSNNHHPHHYGHQSNRYGDRQHRDRDRRYYRAGEGEGGRRSPPSKRRDDYDSSGRSSKRTNTTNTNSDASARSNRDRSTTVTTLTPSSIMMDPRDRLSRQQTPGPPKPQNLATFDNPTAQALSVNNLSQMAKSQLATSSGVMVNSPLFTLALKNTGAPPVQGNHQYTAFSPNFAQPRRPSFPNFYSPPPPQASPLTSGGFLPYNVLDGNNIININNNASAPSHALYNMQLAARNLFMPAAPSSNLNLLGHHHLTPTQHHYNNLNNGAPAEHLLSPRTQPQMPFFIPSLNAGYPLLQESNRQHQLNTLPLNGVSTLDTLPTPQTIVEPMISLAALKSKKVNLPSQKLPKDWKTAIDASTGKPYYYHKITKQVQWDPPVCNQSDPEEQSSSTNSSTNSSPQSNSSPTGNPQSAGTDMKDRHLDSVKLKEKFRQELSAYVIQCLGPYHKKSCTVGRISSSEDFKYLARKLTHTVMAKELERNGSSIESLRLSTKMKAKTEFYIEKYMEKLGPNFIRPSHS